MAIIETISAVAGKSVISAAAKRATSQLVKSFMTNFVEPKISSVKARAALKTHLNRYLRTLERSSRFVPTIAIQGSAFELEEIYEPLTLVRISDSKEWRVDKFPQGLVTNTARILVVDAGGMGKSTLAKYLLRKSLEELTYFPVIIELRRIKVGQSIKQFICDHVVGSGATDILKDAFSALLSDGSFMLLFDGYDELPDKIREQISFEINALSADLAGCPFILTSRPEAGLSSFPAFTSFNVKPLSIDEAFSLLRRYDKGRGKAEALIEKVKGMQQVHEFLRNPLLVTLLYKAYDYKATIPLKRHIFFRQVYEALYQDHDLSKDGVFDRKKKSGLDIEDFLRVLRAVGVSSFETGEVQYSPEVFQSILQKSVKIVTPLKVDLPSFRSDLVSAVPLFIKDGVDFRWSHKAFQDYFTALFTVVDLDDVRKEKFVRLLFNSSNLGKNENILLMLCELDIELVRRSFSIEYLRGLVISYRESALYSGADSDIDFGLYIAFLQANFIAVKKSEYSNVTMSVEEVHKIMSLASKRSGRKIAMRAGHWIAESEASLIKCEESPEGNQLFSILPRIDPELILSKAATSGHRPVNAISKIINASEHNDFVVLNDEALINMKSRPVMFDAIQTGPGSPQMSLSAILSAIESKDYERRNIGLDEILSELAMRGAPSSIR